MPFGVTSVKITGNPDDGGWSQVHDFKPEEPDKLKARGHLFAVIALSNDDGNLPTVDSGREILTRLHEEYYGNLETSPFYALKDAVEKVIDEFNESLKGSVEIAAASYVEGVLYTACGGGSQAQVFRNNMVAKILTSEKGKVVSASGYPQDNDVFVLGTESFFNNFTEGVIKANLEGRSLDKANESFAGTIHTLTNSGRCGVVIVLFAKEKLLDASTIQKTDQEGHFIKERKQKIKLGLFINSVLGKFPKKVYVKREEFDIAPEKNRKTILSVGVILLILLFVSIGFGVKQKREKDVRATYSEQLNQAIHNFEESKTLFSLDPNRARELFADSRRIVDDLVSQGIKDSALDDLSNKISQNQGTILGEYRQTPELYLDLTLLSNGFSADRMVSSSGDIAILDSNGRKVVKIVIETKKSKVVAGPDQIKDARDMALYSGRIFVLSSDGIYEVGDNNEKLLSRDWGESSFIYAYAGNIYMLDKSNNQIYRFPGVGGSFTRKQEWLAEGTRVDFANFSSWTVDGSIWVAKDNAGIYKFSQGVSQGFEIQGLSPEAPGINSIYSNEELEFLYILDKLNSRIVVLEKSGEFKAQYIDENLAKAKSIVVSEKDRKIIFLNEENKLYSIAIKHL